MSARGSRSKTAAARKQEAAQKEKAQKEETARRAEIKYALQPTHDEDALPRPPSRILSRILTSFSKHRMDWTNEAENMPPSDQCSLVYAVLFNPSPPPQLLGPGYNYLLALIMGDQIVLLQLSEDGRHWDKLPIGAASPSTEKTVDISKTAPESQLITKRTGDDLPLPPAKRPRGRIRKGAATAGKNKENRPGLTTREQPPKTEPAPSVAEATKLVKKLEVSAESSKEDLYALQWIKDPRTLTKWSALAVGGRHGVVKVIDYCSEPPRWGYMVGHAGPVTCFSYSENHPNFLFSGAKDHTIRLWSLRYSICLAIFSGYQGHTGGIFTLDVHPSGRFLASGAHEYSPNKGDVCPWKSNWCLKIWNLFGPENAALLNVIRRHGVQSDMHPVIICSPVDTKPSAGEICCVRWIHIEDSKEYLLLCSLQDKILILGLYGASHQWILKYCVRVPTDGGKFAWFEAIQDPGQRYTYDRTLAVINVANWSDVKQRPKKGKKKSPLLKNCCSSHANIVAVVSGPSELKFYAVRDANV